MGKKGKRRSHIKPNRIHHSHYIVHATSLSHTLIFHAFASSLSLSLLLLHRSAHTIAHHSYLFVPFLGSGYGAVEMTQVFVDPVYRDPGLPFATPCEKVGSRLMTQARDGVNMGLGLKNEGSKAKKTQAAEGAQMLHSGTCVYTHASRHHIPISLQ